MSISHSESDQLSGGSVSADPANAALPCKAMIDRRYDENEIFGFQSVRPQQQNLDPKIVLTQMGFNFASPAINSAAAESMSETRSDPGASNFIQTPSVDNCICRGTIGERS